MGYSKLCTKIIPVPDNHHSGPSTKRYPFLHDIECPPGYGWAESLASGYMQNPDTQASIHYIVDAGDTVGTLDEVYWAWGSGSPSSQGGIHVEQAGYASFSRAQWLGLDEAVGTTYVRPNGQTYTYSAADAKAMAAQYLRVVALWADICKRYGWNPLDAATQQTLQLMVNGQDQGHGTRHRDASEWVGGTNHHDPGEYPWAKFIIDVNEAMNGQPTPVPPTPTPDLLEWIMSLPGAPKDLTYKQFLDDVSDRVKTMLQSEPTTVMEDYDDKGNPVAKTVSFTRAQQSCQVQSIRTARKVGATS